MTYKWCPVNPSSANASDCEQKLCRSSFPRPPLVANSSKRDNESVGRQGSGQLFQPPSRPGACSLPTARKHPWLRVRKGSADFFRPAHRSDCLRCQRIPRRGQLVKLQRPHFYSQVKAFALLAQTGHRLHVMYASLKVTNDLYSPYLCYLML